MQKIYQITSAHGIAAVAWDYIQRKDADEKLALDLQSLSKADQIRWMVTVEQVERKYEHQKSVIAKLAKFFAQHGIKMMILKGYGLSLNYPVPNHRQCSDIDIWLFEEKCAEDGSVERYGVQQKADKLLHEHYNIPIDEGKHHHTVFYIDGVMVENHYDFLNIHAHCSNRDIEDRLWKLTRQPMEVVEVDGAEVYLPSPDFHALFILRHSASHFAAERISLRHLLDWKFFVERYFAKIDWVGLFSFAEQMNMHKFLTSMNAICISKLGLHKACVPELECDPVLVERVWNEILHPEFAEPRPRNVGYLRSWSYMFRRWWANRWKHRIVYRESLFSTFVVQLWSHMLKPKSLKL